MLVDMAVDAYTLADLKKRLLAGADADKAEAVRRMVETNQLLHYTTDNAYELGIPPFVGGDAYVPVAKGETAVPIPKRIWNINELRRYVRTGNYTYYRRERHQDHQLIGVSRDGANLAIREWKGFMESRGSGRWAFTQYWVKHAKLGLLELPRLEWSKDALVQHIAKSAGWSEPAAEMFFSELEPRMQRRGAGTYRFPSFDVKSSYGTPTYIYPIKARVGIFVSLSGKKQGYIIPNKAEIFHHVPYELSLEQEYDFMYKLLDYAVMVWSDGQYDLGAMLGISDPEHRWHQPDADETEDIVNDLDPEFEDKFDYAGANADGAYPNFFSAMYTAKIANDSTFQYFYKDELKQRYLLRERIPKDYMELLARCQIPMFFNGTKMQGVTV